MTELLRDERRHDLIEAAAAEQRHASAKN